MAELDLSIVLVTFNSRDDVLACLRSLYAAPPMLAYEVVVIDNGSRDGTQETVVEQFPDARLIESGYNAGYAGGNNLGYQNSSGRHVLFLNPDTLVKGEALEQMVECISADARCGALGPRVLNADGSLQSSCYRAARLSTVLTSVFFLDYLPGWEALTGLKPIYHAADYEREMTVDVVSGCCLLAPRRILDEVGGFDDTYWMYGEEADLCERIRAHGYTVRYTPSATIVHLGGATTQDHPLRWRIHVERNRRLFFSKHRGRVALTILRGLLLLDTLRRIVTGTAQVILSCGLSRQMRLKTGRSLGLLCWQLGLLRQGDRPI